MPILARLLENSVKVHAPNMPVAYHIETLRIAIKLIGGKR